MFEKLTVLVVENDLDTAETLGALLSIWGHEAVVTRDAAGASRAMAKKHPDVIIGTGLVATLRSECPGRKRPFVIVIDGDRRRLNSSVVDLAILKPADPDVLFEVLGRFSKKRDLLERSSAAMQLDPPVTVVCLPA